MSVDNSRFSYGRPQWDMDRGELAAASTEVGDQVASKQDLSELLPDSGTMQIPSGTGTVLTGSGWLPFTEQVGDMKGCHASDSPDGGGIILDKVGQWEVKAITQASSGGITVSAEAELRLEVWNPDGVFLKRGRARNTIGSLGNTSMFTFTKVIVDRPGYLVRCYGLSTGVGNATWGSGEGSVLSADYVYNGAVNFGGAS